MDASKECSNANFIAISQVLIEQSNKHDFDSSNMIIEEKPDESSEMA